MLPLTGIRVIDLGQYIAGPCAGVLLAEMGAEVIKIESPDGDPFRAWEAETLNATFVAYNRGKRSVVLDLKQPEQRQKLYELVATADVLIENFRTGVTQRLGIDFEEMKKHSSKLIYCSISGFGSIGRHANLPAYDGVASGYSGFAHVLLDPDRPTPLGPAMADAITGHAAAFAIVSYLLHRQTNPGPKLLEVPMVGAVTHFLHSAVSKSVVEDLEEGPYGRAHKSQTYVFTPRDGRPIMVHLSSPQKFWEGLCRAVGRPELIEDERFLKVGGRRKGYDVVWGLIQEAMAAQEHDRDTWIELLQAQGVPCAPVNSIREALESDLMKDLGIIDTVIDPDNGPMPQIRPPVRVDGHVLEPVRRAPYLGEDNESVLGSLPGAAVSSENV